MTAAHPSALADAAAHPGRSAAPARSSADGAPALAGAAGVPERAAPAGAAGRPGTAVCVFAVRHTGGQDLAGTPGHPEGGPVGLLDLPGTGLAAVVQTVPADDFTQDALRRRLSDPSALESCARSHHAVITAAAAGGPVVPLPLATLFTGPGRAVAALGEQQSRFLAALDRVRGRSEWAVKVHVAPAEPGQDRVPDGAAAPGPGPASGSASGSGSESGSGPAVSGPAAPGRGAGAAYLARVRGRERDRRSRQDRIRRVSDHVHQVAASHAVAAVRRPPHSTAITGKDRPQVLNAAFLVDDGRAAGLVAAVRALAGVHGGLDVRIDVSGPWVPYSFTGEDRAGAGAGPGADR